MQTSPVMRLGLNANIASDASKLQVLGTDPYTNLLWVIKTELSANAAFCYTGNGGKLDNKSY